MSEFVCRSYGTNCIECRYFESCIDLMLDGIKKFVQDLVEVLEVLNNARKEK